MHGTITEKQPTPTMSTAFFTHAECSLHDMGEGHPECPQRLDAISDQLLASGLDIALNHREAPLATIEQIERAHTAHYVTQLKDFMEQVRNEHRMSGDAISRRDAAAARRCATRHIQQGERRLELGGVIGRQRAAVRGSSGGGRK